MSSELRLIVPALGGVYSALDRFTVPLIRIALGALLVPHGLQKLFGWFGGRGLQANTELFGKLGHNPPWLWGNIVVATEVLGGLLLVIGLLTRPAAVAVGIFAFMAILQTSAKGFFWSNGGSEYSILLFVCALFVLIRGAGGFSVDRAIGREF